MSWSSVISSDNVVAIHAVLIPTPNGDGEILMVGGDNHYRVGNETNDTDHSERFNCRNPTLPLLQVHTPPFDLFCCGHAFLGDGRPLFAGGTAEFPPDAMGIHDHLHFDGHRHSAIYNYLSGTLNQAADMNHEPGLTTGGGRWYPTLCTLGNGDVFIFQGHPEGDDDRHGNNTPERYQLTSGSWILLPAIGTIPGNPIVYPRLHVLNDGKIFVSSEIYGYSYNIKIDPFTGAVEQSSPFPVPDVNPDGTPDKPYSGFDCPSVHLPLNSSDGYTSRILLCGGQTSQLINLGDTAPTWTTVFRDGHQTGVRRGTSCATLLPTGQVVLTGGTDSIINPEIYSPITGEWTTINDSPARVRNYHSSALLMPDGNIWTAGGNLVGPPGFGQPDVAPSPDQKSIEIYTPPYPAGTRPVINSCPTSASYGSTIQVETNDATIVNNVVLMRCGSSTHAYNPDQRAINLDFTTNANTISATIPTNPNVAIPGQYMLFTVDTVGRPCQYAKFIRIARQSFEIITDHSTFSVLEVDAQPAGNAIFQNAFYVFYDGFLPSELGNFTTYPSITFTLVSSGSVISTVQAIPAGIELEIQPAPPDIPQRVTFAFDVLFTSNAVFNFADPTAMAEDVTVTATLLQNECEAVISLTKAPNPYMVDGPTSWLSTDVRVFKIIQGSPLPTFAQGIPTTVAPGSDFISALLTRFNSLLSDGTHPFNEIDQDNLNISQVELSETFMTHAVHNYAIAKVHYKAPVPIPPATNIANDVRVFFRLFNTAGTAMQYNELTTYRRAGTTAADSIALIGKEGNAISSIPFFAAPLVNYQLASMATQHDDQNKIPLHPNTTVGVDETIAYFGCWLDINQPVPLIPLNPVNDGPFLASNQKSIQELTRGIHQCLVAEIYFAGDPTTPNATPGSSDNLSQRNLVTIDSDNPGSTATHTVQHTFEIKPSQFFYNNNSETTNSYIKKLHSKATASIDKGELAGPDVLLIHWNNLPRESKIIVYLPDVNVDDILALEPYARLSPTRIIKEDENSFSFISSDINYIPVLGGFEKNIPGLLTIELPDTVIKGQLFKVLVQQARFYRNTRRIIGSFQFNIPVSTAGQILIKEMRNLSILKHVRQAIPVTDPWWLIYNRLIKGLSDKVSGLGGDASNVPASPNDKWLAGNPTDTQSNNDNVLITLMNQCCKRMSILVLIVIILLLLLIILLLIRLS